MKIVKKSLKKLIKIIPVPLQNKYAIAAIFFVMWMLIFDKHDFLTQISLSNTLSKLENEKIYYKDEIKNAILDRKNIQQNMEKYARENYYMKRKDEDVFIFVDK